MAGRRGCTLWRVGWAAVATLVVSTRCASSSGGGECDHSSSSGCSAGRGRDGGGVEVEVDAGSGGVKGSRAAVAAGAWQRTPSGKEAAAHLPPWSEWDAVVRIPAGSMQLGTATPHFAVDAEGPTYEYSLPADLWMDQYEVSIERFARWVVAAGWTSDAERFGWSFVHEGAVPAARQRDITQSVHGAEWWLPVHGAAWFAPEGPDSAVIGRWDHPVVHVSHADATAFCAAAGGRLPTDDEWEYAARGGKRERMYPWGNALMSTGGVRHRANVWQGSFPYNNTAEDGWTWAAPATALGPQNAWGLHHMAGNVWEWTATTWCPEDDAAAGADPAAPRRHRTDPARTPPDCGRRPASVRARQRDDAGEVEWVKKGGSFLCHPSSCFRYRTAARHKNTANTSAYNLGFRCVYDSHPPGRPLATRSTSP